MAATSSTTATPSATSEVGVSLSATTGQPGVSLTATPGPSASTSSTAGRLHLERAPQIVLRKTTGDVVMLPLCVLRKNKDGSFYNAHEKYAPDELQNLLERTQAAFDAIGFSDVGIEALRTGTQFLIKFKRTRPLEKGGKEFSLEDIMDGNTSMKTNSLEGFQAMVTAYQDLFNAIGSRMGETENSRQERVRNDTPTPSKKPKKALPPQAPEQHRRRRPSRAEDDSDSEAASAAEEAAGDYRRNRSGRTGAPTSLTSANGASATDSTAAVSAAAATTATTSGMGLT